MQTPDDDHAQAALGASAPVRGAYASGRARKAVFLQRYQRSRRGARDAFRRAQAAGIRGWLATRPALGPPASQTPTEYSP